MGYGLQTYGDSTRREDLAKKPKFSKVGYWQAKQAKKNRKKKRK